MPITVSVVNGIPSSPLSPGDQFMWTNPTPHNVHLTGCIGFCTQDTYQVLAATSPSSPGETSAYVSLAPTNWSFQESPTTTWNPGGINPPSTPRIQNPSKVEAA
jgi:hypothetical protein